MLDFFVPPMPESGSIGRTRSVLPLRAENGTAAELKSHERLPTKFNGRIGAALNLIPRASSGWVSKVIVAYSMPDFGACSGPSERASQIALCRGLSGGQFRGFLELKS